ncbi:MAG: hypothetical protein HQL52_04325 [Magnetococcales bacterium]|nr:hypothetical protein [Magnetococcales bacterium]
MDQMEKLGLKPRYEIEKALLEGSEIIAIRIFRQATGQGLAQAKAAVSQFEQKLRKTKPYAFKDYQQSGSRGRISQAPVAKGSQSTPPDNPSSPDHPQSVTPDQGEDRSVAFPLIVAVILAATGVFYFGDLPIIPERFKLSDDTETTNPNEPEPTKALVPLSASGSQAP